jgi:fumarate reductase subunit D
MENNTPGSEHAHSEAPKPATAMPHFDKKDIDDNKVLAALSYLWILVFIPLFLKKDSKFAQEHAKQGLIMFIVGLVGMFIFWIPLIGWLAWLVLVILNLIAIIKCLMGEFWEVPVLGALRKNINI